MGMSRPTAGAMVCGWITFAPKYASSMASLYESESMTVASGTRRGSADSTPSTSVQMWISLASSSAPKMEPEKSLPLRPSVVCTPRRSEATKPVMMSVPLKAWADGGCQLLVGLRPLHRRAERAPLHDQHRARVDPLHVAGAARALLEVAVEQPGRPQLAVAGDEVADVAGRRAREAHGVQDAFEVVAVAVEARPGRARADSGRSSVSAMVA